MALPRGTTGSLCPTFVSARLVGLTVRQAYAIALNERFPTALSQPSHASVTLWEATAPVKLPTSQCSTPGLRVVVRFPVNPGWYFKVGSTRAGALASLPATYPTHADTNASVKL